MNNIVRVNNSELETFLIDKKLVVILFYNASKIDELKDIIISWIKISKKIIGIQFAIISTNEDNLKIVTYLNGKKILINKCLNDVDEIINYILKILCKTYNNDIYYEITETEKCHNSYIRGCCSVLKID